LTIIGKSSETGIQPYVSRGQVVPLQCPGIGQGILELYSNGRKKLIFFAHGFTKRVHLTQMLAVLRAWPDARRVGFMVPEFQSLTRGGDKDYIKDLLKVSPQLDPGNTGLATTGIADSVVAPHHSGDVISGEMPDLVAALSAEYDLAVLRDWKWDTS